MRNQRFGIEIEMTGLTRKKAAEILAEYFDTTACYEGGSYDTYVVVDAIHREWKVVYDASIQFNSRNRENVHAHKVELVSPICTYADIEDIQQIIRKLKAKGRAIVTASCGIHIHVDASSHTAKTLKNLANIMFSKEEMIYKALQVRQIREFQYCKKIDATFIEKMHRNKPKTIDNIKDIWYNGNLRRSQIHYDESRYHGLNFHSIFNKGTVEFRLFNGTLHAGKIKAYIQFCLAISHQALTQQKVSRIKTSSTNEKYTFRTWLLRLGMIGDEFKTARKHLLAHLDGGIAWKDPSQAVEQRRRLASRERQESNHQEDISEAREEIEEEMRMTTHM